MTSICYLNNYHYHAWYQMHIPTAEDNQAWLFREVLSLSKGNTFVNRVISNLNLAIDTEGKCHAKKDWKKYGVTLFDGAAGT